MSLAIEIGSVKSVLLGGTWHDVEKDSFTVDSYEFVEGENIVHGGGDSGLCATGFEFKSGGAVLSGPLTAIQAVSDKPMRERLRKA